MSDLAEGFLPLEDGPVSAAIGAMLAQANKDAGARATSDNTPARGSQALQCARKIGFEIAGYPPDLELEDATLLAFRYGKIAHDDLIQPALVKFFDAEVEVAATWMPEFPVSCWLDAVYKPNRAMLRAARFRQVAVEIKSMATFGYELAAGLRRRIGEMPGPKAEHVVQCAIGALAPNVGADGVHIIYLSKERGSTLEWIFGVDDPLPNLGGLTPREMVGTELVRMKGIVGRIEAGELPRPIIPGYGLVTDPPARGSKGQPWLCRYCAYQPTCASISVDVVPLSKLHIVSST